MTSKTFNMDGKLWHKFKTKVEKENRTIQEVLTELLSWYVNRK